MNYFVCTIGEFGEYSDRIAILNECLRRNVYMVHRDARWPAHIRNIKKGDALLLKLQSQLVAWGIAKAGLRNDTGADGWDRIVDVEKWDLYDAGNPANGVHHYGIQGNTLPGAGQFAIVKQVAAAWAEQKLALFRASGQPHVDSGAGDRMVSCEHLISFGKVISRGLSIPHYQRCFCWRKENVLDMLETMRMRFTPPLANPHDDTHQDTYLGTIILKREGSEDGGITLSIVDGQQRLLTLAILVFSMGESPPSLLQHPLGGTSNDARSARKHLYWAKITIDNWLRTNLQPQNVKQFHSYLQNSILFTVVTLPQQASEDLAYTFFDAVNSAGKKLSDYDLLKAHHLRFIADEPKASAMAQRWDANFGEYDDVLCRALYRLRSWSRRDKPAVDAQNGHALFKHFSANPPIDGVFFPPLTARFNSAVQGGEPFFDQAEKYRLLWSDFKKTPAHADLFEFLSGHSGNVLRDSIAALLFLFYCKYSGCYLDDSLFCTAEVVSSLRNDTQVRATKIQEGLFTDCVFALDTAVDPGQYFAWCLSPERRYVPKIHGKTALRYWEALSNLYDQLAESRCSPSLRERCGKRAGDIRNAIEKEAR